MKSLRKLCAIVVLTLAIAVPAFPGDISCPGATPPPPPELSQGCVAGDISCPGASSGSSYTNVPDQSGLDPVTELTLDLIQTLMSLF